MKFALILPTRNPGELFPQWLDALTQQIIKPEQIIIIDSESTDGTPEKAQQQGFIIHKIAMQNFNHGGTRNLGASLLNDDIEIVIFMTQDAILHSPQSLAQLLAAFTDKNVTAAYGRQLPHTNANPLATHARFFNYPPQSSRKTMRDIPRLGIKTPFLSNAFAAYRVTMFRELGGFPEKVILGEDMYLTGKMILSGYDIAYCAEAIVRHSHNYTLYQEMRRYFDIGVFHQQQDWIRKAFGHSTGEGKRFVLSEWKYLYRHAPSWIPRSLCITLGKWLGYQLGLHWKRIPKRFLPYLSLHKNYSDFYS